MKKFLFAMVLAFGLTLSLACDNTTPYGPSGLRRGVTPTPTATNLNGYTSTPTATLQPTPPFLSAWGVNSINGLAEGNGYLYEAQADGASVAQVQLVPAPGGGAAAATWTGYGSTLFRWPIGVAVNSATGNVYVLDSGDANGLGAAVYEFTSSVSATGVTSWGGYGSLRFSAPAGIALDSSGNVYVADMFNQRVEEFGSGGTTLGSWNDNGDSSFLPTAVAVDSSGNIFAADAGNFAVWKLSSIGGTSASWSLPYPADPNNEFYGLAVDAGGNVYVADYGNSEVDVFDNNGNAIGRMDGGGGGGTPFLGPDALLLYNGNLYVGDYDNNNVQVFGPNPY